MGSNLSEMTPVMNILFNKKAGIIGLGFLLISSIGFAQESTGKRLILHCDDLGVSHSVNQAAIDLYEKGLITSASIMVPTPFFIEIARYGVEHPDFDLGLHLTLTSEWENYKWGPVSGREKVPSLLDNNGYLYATSEEVVKNARPEEVEIELKAQIEMALSHGLKPTHFDSHMGVLFSPSLFEVYLKVGAEYGIPVFVPKKQLMAGYPDLAEGVNTENFKINSYWGADPNISPENWTQAYIDFVETLTEGTTLMIIHLGYDNAELEYMMGKEIGWGSAWRQRDTEAILDQRFINAIKENDVVLTNYKELYK